MLLSITTAVMVAFSSTQPVDSQAAAADAMLVPEHLVAAGCTPGDVTAVLVRLASTDGQSALDAVRAARDAIEETQEQHLAARLAFAATPGDEEAEQAYDDAQTAFDAAADAETNAIASLQDVLFAGVTPSKLTTYRSILAAARTHSLPAEYLVTAYDLDTLSRALKNEARALRTGDDPDTGLAVELAAARGSSEYMLASARMQSHLAEVRDLIENAS